MSSNPPIRDVPHEVKNIIIQNLVPDRFYARTPRTHSLKTPPSAYFSVQALTIASQVASIRRDSMALETIDECWKEEFRRQIATKTTFEIDITRDNITVMGKRLRPTMEHPTINLRLFPETVDLTQVRHWAIHIQVETWWSIGELNIAPTSYVLQRLLALPTKPGTGNTAIESIEIKLIKAPSTVSGVTLSQLGLTLEKGLAGMKGRGLRTGAICFKLDELRLHPAATRQLKRDVLEPLHAHVEQD